MVKDNEESKYHVFLMQNLHLNIFTYDVKEHGLFAGKMNSRKRHMSKERLNMSGKMICM